MIDWLDELNRSVIAVSELMDEHRTAHRVGVIEQCKSIVIESRLPDHEATLAFAQQLGLLACDPQLVHLTDAGQAFLELNPEHLYELTADQKALLIRTCYLGERLQAQTHKLFQAFQPSYERVSFRWSEYDSSPLEGEPWVVEHLAQLGVLVRGAGTLEVPLEFAAVVDTFRFAPKGWSEEQFRAYLKEKQELGDLAEQLVVEEEANRLRLLGCRLEAACVHRVSKVRVNAGYDIESYDGKSTGLTYDRYIEVKGSREPRVRFFWSHNEIEVAKTLGAKYWIYYQGGISVKDRAARNRVLMFQEPAKSILDDAALTKIPQGIIVEGGMRGAAIAGK